MVTKEFWWAGPDAAPFKNSRWAKPLSGQRSDLFDWLRAQEAALERSLALEMSRDQAKPGSQSIHANAHEPSAVAWTLDDESEEDE